MRAVVQRVSRAEVSAGGRCLGRIGGGFAVLLGVARDDTEADAEFIADRILGLRVFADDAGNMNQPGTRPQPNGLVARINCGNRVTAECHYASALEARSDKTVDCRSSSRLCGLHRLGERSSTGVYTHS